MLLRPSCGGLWKTVFSGRGFLSGSAICPSDVLHVAASTFRADVDIYVPDCFQKFCHRQIGIFCFETLVALEFKYQFQVSGLIPVIQKAIIAYFLKTGRQHMHQIAVDEFRIIQSDRPAWSTRCSASCRKSYLLFIYWQDTAVRYGGLMSIPAQIFNGIAKAIESFFDIRAPILLIKGIPEFRPFIRIAQFFTGSWKIQLSVLKEWLQACEKFTLELIPQDFHPEKEVL